MPTIMIKISQEHKKEVYWSGSKIVMECKTTTTNNGAILTCLSVLGFSVASHFNTGTRFSVFSCK